MNRPILLIYQIAIGVSDTLTGMLLVIAPQPCLQLMGLQVPLDALPYLSFIGAFVFSVGLACLYGALVMARSGDLHTLGAVWLLTAITRASVAIFVVAQILTHSLALGWLTVAGSDGACVVIQAVGLRRHWLENVAQ